MIDRPRCTSAAATLYDSNACLRLSRSRNTMPAHSAANPKSGIRRSSDFAMKLHHGTSDASAKMSNQLTWFEMNTAPGACVSRSPPAVSLDATAGRSTDRPRPPPHVPGIDRVRTLRHAEQPRDHDGRREDQRREERGHRDDESTHQDEK